MVIFKPGRHKIGHGLDDLQHKLQNRFSQFCFGRCIIELELLAVKADGEKVPPIAKVEGKTQLRLK